MSKLCGFCNHGTGVEVENVCGTLYTDGNCSAHKKCMQYSAKLVQYNPVQYDALGGFQRRQVQKEIKRGQQLKCKICKGKKKRARGATAGCAVKKCKASFHFGCAKEDAQAITRRMEVTYPDSNDPIVEYRVFCCENHEQKYNTQKRDLGIKCTSDTADSSDNDDGGYADEEEQVDEEERDAATDEAITDDEGDANTKDESEEERDDEDDVAETDESDSEQDDEEWRKMKIKRVKKLKNGVSRNGNGVSRNGKKTTPRKKKRTIRKPSTSSSSSASCSASSDASNDEDEDDEEEEDEEEEPFRQQQQQQQDSDDQDVDYKGDLDAGNEAQDDVELESTPQAEVTEEEHVIVIPAGNERTSNEDQQRLKYLASQVTAVALDRISVHPPTHMHCLQLITDALGKGDISEVERLISQNQQDTSVLTTSEQEQKIRENLLVAKVKYGKTVGELVTWKRTYHVLFLIISNTIDPSLAMRIMPYNKGELIQWATTTTIVEDANLSESQRKTLNKFEEKSLCSFLEDQLETPEIECFPKDRFWLADDSSSSVTSKVWHRFKEEDNKKADRRSPWLIFMLPMDKTIVVNRECVHKRLHTLLNSHLTSFRELYCVLDVGSDANITSYREVFDSLPEFVSMKILSCLDPGKKLPVSCVIVHFTMKYDDAQDQLGNRRGDSKSGTGLGKKSVRKRDSSSKVSHALDGPQPGTSTGGVTPSKRAKHTE